MRILIFVVALIFAVLLAAFVLILRIWLEENTKYYIEFQNPFYVCKPVTKTHNPPKPWFDTLDKCVEALDKKQA